MTLGIDPATGKAVGAPRQVSSEPVVYQGPPSPDGRWLSYVTGSGSAEGKAELKVIPATGGTPRTLAEFGAGTPIFSRDSRFLYFTARERIRGVPCSVQECQFVLKKVAVEGGQPQILAASAEFPLMVLAGDERFTIQGALRTGVGPVDRVVVRTLDGREVGAVDLPDRAVPVGPFGDETGDGTGLLLRANGWTSSVRVASANGDPIKILTRTGQNWPEAWTPSGDAVITDRPATTAISWEEPAGLAVELLPLDGSKGKVIPVPGAIRKQGGWRSSIGPWFSYLAGTPLAHHAINVTTGQTRRISQRPVRLGLGLQGRGGLEQDGASWVYAEADAANCGTWVCAASGFTIKRTDPATGETQVVRSFPQEPAPPRRYGFNVHGTRLLHFAERGDSVDLVFTSGPDGSTERLASFKKGEVPPDEGPVWSWKGDRAAICGRAGGDPQHPILMILTIPDRRDVKVERQDYELGTGDICWEQNWQPDDSGLFMVGVMQRGGRQDILQFSLRPGSRPVALTKDDPDAVVGEYLPSPDGRQVAYPVQYFRGSSIYLVDLKPLLKLPK